MTFLTPKTPNFEAALRDARSQRPEARLRAAERLASPPAGAEARAREALEALATDEYGPIRALAVEGLGHVGEADDALLAAFDDPDVHVRQHAVMAAARRGLEGAVRDALTHDQPELRFQAALAMAALRPNETVRDVGPLLDDDDPEVRVAAAEALGGAGDPAAAELLAARLDDPAEPVRVATALALADLDDPRGIPVLRAHLPDPEHTVPVAEALGRLHATEAQDDLRTLARRWWISPLLRAAAAGALARLGDPLGERTLRKVLRAFRPDGRDYAARVLADLASE